MIWIAVNASQAGAITAGQGETVSGVEASRNGKAIEVQAIGTPGDNFVIVLSAKESYYIEETRVYFLEFPELQKTDGNLASVTARTRKKIEAPATVSYNGQQTVIEFKDAAEKATWKISLTSQLEGKVYLAPLQLE